MSDFPIRSRRGGTNPYISSDANMPETKPPREPGAAYVFVPTLAACALLLLYVGVGVVTGVSTDYGVSSVRGSSANVLRVATWNVAAINNNPFEYWITHDDKAYNKLMSDVQEFVSNPGERDVIVEEVFSDQMWDALAKKMKSVGWQGVEEVDKMWNDDFRSRKIIDGFLTDSTLGKKRLASMPDRVTNTIRTENGNVMRPTVINCFSGDLSTQEKWFREWLTFMFETRVKDQMVYETLLPIKRSKYPALSEDEERLSIPLQTLCGAIFDAILVHMMNSIAPTTWQPLRSELCAALNSQKDTRTLEILERTYGDADVLFVQEAASAFVRTASTALGDKYHILAPASMDPKRDQNSLVFLCKKRFPATASEFTDEVLSSLSKAPVANGDLYAATVFDSSNRPFVVASFHGDTNGLATIPVTDALLEKIPENHKLLFGLDANTYEKEREGYQGAAKYQAFIIDKGLASQHGVDSSMDVKRYTTFNARTYLQPQLNKAVAFDERYTNINVDRNPKDFILYTPRDFELVDTGRDNTGERTYTEDMMFPTLKFPSDHGVTAATLRLLPRRRV